MLLCKLGPGCANKVDTAFNRLCTPTHRAAPTLPLEVPVVVPAHLVTDIVVHWLKDAVRQVLGRKEHVARRPEGHESDVLVLAEGLVD